MVENNMTKPTGDNDFQPIEGKREINSTESSLNNITRLNDTIPVINSTLPIEKSSVEWLLLEDFNGQPAWGIQNGLVISIYSADLGGIGGGDGGPKGLFRVHKHGEKGLAWVNFLSLEPETSLGGGLSEYEAIDFIPQNFTLITDP